MCEFKDIEINEQFCIPFHLNHEMETFQKLNFNKAKLLLTGEIHHFNDEFSVWKFEINVGN